jgi:hypothetical protein
MLEVSDGRPCFRDTQILIGKCSTYLMWTSISHMERYGPFSEHARTEDAEKGMSRNADATTAAQGNHVRIPETDDEELKESEDDGSQVPAGESADDGQAPCIPMPVMPTPSIEMNNPTLGNGRSNDGKD